MVNGILFDRVLSIGINYVGTEAELNGCLNDVINLKNKTKSKIHVIMSELSGDPRLTPTKANIIREITKFTAGLKRGMKLFFQYSGHGSYTRDVNSDESDKRDETICPIDYARYGDITDDYLRKLLVDSLPRGVTLWCFFDCCHSGTIMDLRHNYKLTRVARSRRVKFRVRHSRRIRASRAQVICFSGCLDNQESADFDASGTGRKKGYQGAMTWGILRVMDKLRKKRIPMTYSNIMAELLLLMRRSGFDQVPQISTGQLLNMNSIFGKNQKKKTKTVFKCL